MFIEGALTSSDNPRFDIKAVQVPPPGDCPVPEFTQDLSTANQGFVTLDIQSSDGEGITEISFTDPDGEPRLVNFIAEPQNEDFTSAGDGIVWTFNGDSADAPLSLTFKLFGDRPDDVEPGQPFEASFFARIENACGEIIDIDPVLTISDRPAAEFALHGNYPNPFAEATTIQFALTDAADVRLEVFDLTGRVVATLVSGQVDAGTHEVRWDGTLAAGHRAPSGVYVVRLIAGDKQSTQRITRVR